MTSNYVESKGYLLPQATVILFLWLITFSNLTYSQVSNMRVTDYSAALKLADETRRYQPLIFQKTMEKLTKVSNLTKEQQHFLIS